MSKRFDDLAMSLASEGTVGRRSMIRGALAALGLGAGAVVAGAKPAAAAPGGRPVSCPPGLTSCDGLCRDLTSSHANCGGCSNVCELDSVCSNGQCVKVACTCEPSCPTGLTWCTGACVNTQTDEANCGGCGKPCASGQVCSNGSCIAGTACMTVADCPGSDDDCQSRTCTNGICGVVRSPDGTTCAGGNGTCVDGICTNTCPGVDLMTDPNNCGTCGNVCPSVNSTAICANGTCGHGTCNPGFADCDPNQPGCETDITNNENCGACGTVCLAGTACMNGICEPETTGCATASDCPGTDTICKYRTCTDGTCGFGYASSDTQCGEGRFCDGLGTCP